MNDRSTPESQEMTHWGLLRRTWVIAGFWLVYGSKWLHYRILRPSTKMVLTSLYLLSVITVSLVVAFCGDSRPLTSDESGLFATVGAMIAGMLAIVFALRTLLIQNAAMTQSSGLFDIVARDRRQNVSYWLLALFSLLHIVIASVLTGSPGMLSFVTSEKAVGVVIFTTGFSLYLIFDELSRLYRRVNPLHSIDFAKTKILWLLSQIGDTAELQAKYIRAKARDDQSVSDSKRLAASFLLLRRPIAAVSTYLTFLFDYHDKLYQQRENTAARLVLQAIGEIAVKYVDIRQSSFFLVQSTEPFVAESDSQKFFSDLLEPLVSKAKRYIQSGDDDGVIEIIRVLETLTAKATKVQFIGELRRENPLVQQCLFHLGLIIEYAGRHQNVEGLFQGVKALGRISALTASVGLSLEAQSISKALNGAAFAGIIMHNETIWTEALFSLGKVLEAYGISRPGHHTRLVSFVFDYIRFTLNTTFTGIGRSLAGASNRAYHAFSLPFEVATRIIFCLSQSVGNEHEELAVTPTILVEMCEEYRWFLRKLSQDIKCADSYFVEEAAKSVCQVSTLLLTKRSSPGFDSHQDDLQKAISSLLNQLVWFAHHAEEIKNEHSFDSLVESAAKIGMHAVDNGNVGIAVESIKVIESLATEYANKKQEPFYGMHVPRILKRACFVGILALKTEQQDVIRRLEEVLIAIDAKAKKQEETLKALPETSGITLNHVESEVGQLYETCTREKYNPHPLFDSSQDQLFVKIECKDIDDFCERFWGFKASEEYRSYPLL